MNDLLTRLESSGAVGFLPSTASLAERNALAVHLMALRAAGHAITVGEVMNCGEMSGEVMVAHYRSCRACARNRKDVV